MPVSIERIIAENRLTNAIFRRAWSWRDYTLQYIYIFAIIASLIAFDYNMRVLLVPLWVYGFVCIMYIAVRIAFNVSANKEAAEKEDALIKYILNENTEVDEVFSKDEIKERLLSHSYNSGRHASFDEFESWRHWEAQ
jgi:ABC-type transport system involved in Fe-S cluster assembly fused permease/ATPase subunit